MLLLLLMLLVRLHRRGRVLGHLVFQRAVLFLAEGVHAVALVDALEHLDTGVCRGPVVGVLGPSLVHQLDVAHGGRENMVILQLRAPWWREMGLVGLHCHLLDDLHNVHAEPGDLSSQHFPHDDGDRVQVDPHALRKALHDLGRHVLRCARDRLGARDHRERPDALGEPEVGHLDPVVRTHQHVERLEVTVDHSGHVHRPQPVHGIQNVPHAHRPRQSQLVVVE
mmetsp:Transcript_32394/g.75447  ORF Transcript_32394/g.75447 Transcript_32394/m.75447 type:complete len:224 (-) Transcript_32394:945-1616(-)